MPASTLIIVTLIMGATLCIMTDHDQYASGFFVVGVVLWMAGAFSNERE